MAETQNFQPCPHLNGCRCLDCPIKHIRETRPSDIQTQQLLEYLCSEMSNRHDHDLQNHINSITTQLQNTAKEITSDELSQLCLFVMYKLKKAYITDTEISPIKYTIYELNKQCKNIGKFAICVFGPSVIGLLMTKNQNTWHTIFLIILILSILMGLYIAYAYLSKINYQKQLKELERKCNNNTIREIQYKITHTRPY